jgi:Flp pilus assembly protein TadD
MAPAQPAVTAGRGKRPAAETTVASLPAASAEPRLPAPPPAPRPVRTTPATARTPEPAAPRPAAPAVKPAASARPSPADVAALYKTGVEQFMNEEYDKALGTFQKVLKNDPGNAKAKEYLGKTKDRLKKLKG